MDLFLIVSDNNTSELKVMKKDSRNDKNVYTYEPIASCATLEEAESLKNTLNQLEYNLFLTKLYNLLKRFKTEEHILLLMNGYVPVFKIVPFAGGYYLYLKQDSILNRYFNLNFKNIFLCFIVS